jgi:hypothetical protein
MYDENYKLIKYNTIIQPNPNDYLRTSFCIMSKPMGISLPAEMHKFTCPEHPEGHIISGGLSTYC